MLVSRLLALGLPGLMTAWLVTPVVLVATYLLGVHVLRIPSRVLCMTLSADMSVCGVSAAIATGAACRAKKEEPSLAIGLALFFTVIMMGAMPPVIRWLELDPILGGAWIGGTIDASGAVVAAGESLGREAGEAWRRFPRLVLGFLGVSLACSWLHALGPEQALRVDGATTGFTARLRGWLFCTGFVCMGLETRVRELAPFLASGRPVVLYLVGQALNLALTLGLASLTFGWLFRKAVEP